MTRGYCEICDEEGINGGLSDDVVPSKVHLNKTVCRKHLILEDTQEESQ
jgi:hypothetical protein